MDTTPKNIFKKILTILLVLFTLYILYIFSVLASFGAGLSLFGPKKGVSEIAIPILACIIGLIIILPIINLIWRATAHRWSTTLRAFLLLWPYLAIGFGGIALALSAFSWFEWFLTNPFFYDYPTFCRVISLSLTIGYYFYFKNVIEPLALKTKV